MATKKLTDDVVEPTDTEALPGPAPTLLTCAEAVVTYLKSHPMYKESQPDYARMDQALMLHHDGHTGAAWGHLVLLIQGITGPMPLG